MTTMSRIIGSPPLPPQWDSPTPCPPAAVTPKETPSTRNTKGLPQRCLPTAPARRQHQAPTSAGEWPSPVSSARSTPRVSGSRTQSSPPSTGALPKMAMGMARWYWPRRRTSGARIPATLADMEHSPTPVCLRETGAVGGVGMEQHPQATTGGQAGSCPIATARLREEVAEGSSHVRGELT